MSGPGTIIFNPVLSPGSRLEPPAKVGTRPAGSDGGSIGSLDSIGSAGSVLSLGSAGSILSIGSVGSVLSIGSMGSVLSIGSIGSVASIGSGFSIGAFGGWCERRGAVVETAASVLAIAALLAAVRR